MKIIQPKCAINNRSERNLDLRVTILKRLYIVE